jgi:hypothetical protein
MPAEVGLDVQAVHASLALPAGSKPASGAASQLPTQDRLGDAAHIEVGVSE